MSFLLKLLEIHLYSSTELPFFPRAMQGLNAYYTLGVTEDHYYWPVQNRTVGGTQQAHVLKAASRKLQEGGGYETIHPAQKLSVAVTGLLYRNILSRGKGSYWLTAQICINNI